MSYDYEGGILFSLRRIIRSIDQHNKQLGAKYKLTVPQLVCLRQLLLAGPSSTGELAKLVYLSQATVTGVLDRLEAKGLVHRERPPNDRRRVLVSLTEKGDVTAREMPWPLQERFAASLKALGEEEQKAIDEVLKKIVVMMEPPMMEVWPYGCEEVLKTDDKPIQPEIRDLLAAQEAVDPPKLKGSTKDGDE